MILLEELLYEDYKNTGSTYEAQVFKSLKAAGMNADQDLGSGSDRHRPDTGFVLFDKHENKLGPYKLEIKKDMKTQLGGSSWDISNPKDIKFLMDIGTSDEMHDAYDEMKVVLEKALGDGGELKTLRRFLKNFKAGTYEVRGKKFKETKEGEEYNASGNGLQCTRLAWTVAQDKGLLKPLNFNIEATGKFMTMHYSNKGIYYAQFGGDEDQYRGLYILGKDPANLEAIGVPRLLGLASKNKFVIEMRATPGGSGKYLYVRIRCQGRMRVTTPVPDDYSPFTLDTPEGARYLLETYTELSPPKRFFLQREAVEEDEEEDKLPLAALFVRAQPEETDKEEQDEEKEEESDVVITKLTPSDDPIDGEKVYTPDNVDLDSLVKSGYKPVT